jgi:hypothetical protein
MTLRKTGLRRTPIEKMIRRIAREEAKKIVEEAFDLTYGFGKFSGHQNESQSSSAKRKIPEVKNQSVRC